MRQIYISLTIGADFVPLVPLSMPVSYPLCRVPRRFRAARAAFHAGFVPLCKDMSKHVKICRDAPRYVKICPDVSRYVKRCQDMSRDVKKV